MGSEPSGDGSGSHHEDIVVVGGGIGGLACALALHRVGLKAVVLEQSDMLRVGGAALGLWSNAFRVLDALGLSAPFRASYTNLCAWEVLNSGGKTLKKLDFADCDGGPHELRAVERTVLLKALAAELPEGTIRFNSRVSGIMRDPSVTHIQLHDGSTYSAKVVIGFDGINSCVGAWMGLPKAQPVSQVGIVGVATFPESHQFEAKAQLFVGRRCRTGYLPCSSTNVFWFIVWNESFQEWKNTSEDGVKDEALELVSRSFPSTPLQSIISNTKIERLTKTRLRHRVNDDPEALVRGSVTVAGDAAHPTTPFMGQGGCMALEDAVVLARKLHGAMEAPTELEAEDVRVHRALVEFQRERYARTKFITTRSYRIGSVLQTSWAVMDFVRDWVLVPFLMNKKTFLAHTLFDVGDLPRRRDAIVRVDVET